MEDRLLSAIEEEDYRLATKIVCQGEDTGSLNTQDGINILHLISGQNNPQASSLLHFCLEKGADPNIKSPDGVTPVHVASLWKRLPNLKLLISYGGDPDELDDEGRNALDYACLSCEKENDNGCLKFLLEHDHLKIQSRESDLVSRSLEKTNIDRVKLKDDTLSVPLKRSGESDSDELTDSFYTAIADNSDMAFSFDDSIVTFPKLHPWTTKRMPTDLDKTVAEQIANLNIHVKHDDSCSDFKEPSVTEESDEDLDDSVFMDVTQLYDWKEFSVLEQTCDNSVIVPDSCRKLSDIQLRDQLTSFGEVPGPITPVTRQVYLKRLVRLQSGSTSSQATKYSEYFPELRAHLEGRSVTPDLSQVEESMCEEFNLNKDWREGTEKSSFNYLLLDPRVTQNLPKRARNMIPEDVFRVFVLSIFYVGKGKRSRPYAHLYEGLNSTKKNPKLQHIDDIWSDGRGVVSLHIFQSVIPVEAYTREACMIDALGLSRLTNKKRGDYYGRAKWWPPKKKREMGVYLLKRALKIFLSEGEREIKARDLKSSHS